MAEVFFDNKKPMIPVIVSLNGKKGVVRVHGIIDTGSTLCAIPPEVAETLGYDLDEKEDSANVSTSDGLKEVPTVTLDEVTIMGVTATRVKTAVVPFPEETRVNCLVGLTYLRNFNMSVDFSTGTLTLE